MMGIYDIMNEGAECLIESVNPEKYQHFFANKF